MRPKLRLPLSVMSSAGLGTGAGHRVPGVSASLSWWPCLLKHFLTSLPFLVQTLARGFGTRMFHLRTCAAKLRPLTASQTVRTFSQNRPAAARTFGQVRGYTAPVAAEPFLSGTSSNYVEEMYYAWLENPKSVHKVRLSKQTSSCVWCLGLPSAGHPGKCQCAEEPLGRQAAGSPTDRSPPHQPDHDRHATRGALPSP